MSRWIAVACIGRFLPPSRWSADRPGVTVPSRSGRRHRIGAKTRRDGYSTNERRDGYSASERCEPGTGSDGTVSSRSEGEIDAETLIRSLSVVLDTPGAPTLEPTFRRAWRERTVEIRETETRLVELGRALELEPDRLVLEVAPDGLLARYDGSRVGCWPSAAALLADLSATAIIPDVEPRWRSLSGEQRRVALRTLRLFVRRCPNCDGTLEGVLGPSSTDDRLEECRRVQCDQCGSVLFHESTSSTENVSGKEDTP
ncbi:hypothetical protein D8S78_16835 [Natrialba swarupiae]|nr:hypothetical protein [Natrialba swarupiae]